MFVIVHWFVIHCCSSAPVCRCSNSIPVFTAAILLLFISQRRVLPTPGPCLRLQILSILSLNLCSQSYSVLIQLIQGLSIQRSPNQLIQNPGVSCSLCQKNQRPALRRWSLVMMVPHCKFGFFFNHVMKVLHFGVLRSSSLVFVDDEVMLVTSGGHSRMIINISSRSETVVLSWKEVTSPLRVKNKLLHQVEKFRYLGVFFTREGSRRLWTWMKWCRRCICLFSEERVKHESEVMIHLSIYVPTLAYGHSSE